MQEWPDSQEEEQVVGAALTRKQIQSVLTGPSVLHFGTCSSGVATTKQFFVVNTLAQAVHVVVDTQSHEHLATSPHCSQACFCHAYMPFMLCTVDYWQCCNPACMICFLWQDDPHLLQQHIYIYATHGCNATGSSRRADCDVPRHCKQCRVTPVMSRCRCDREWCPLSSFYRASRCAQPCGQAQSYRHRLCAVAT